MQVCRWPELPSLRLWPRGASHKYYPLTHPVSGSHQRLILQEAHVRFCEPICTPIGSEPLPRYDATTGVYEIREWVEI